MKKNGSRGVLWYTKNKGSVGIFKGFPTRLRRDFLQFHFRYFLLSEIEGIFTYFMNSSVTHLKPHVNIK